MNWPHGVQNALTPGPPSFLKRKNLMQIDAITIGNNPPHDVNVIIEVPVGEMPDPWPTLMMPRVRGR